MMEMEKMMKNMREMCKNMDETNMHEFMKGMNMSDNKMNEMCKMMDKIKYPSLK